MEKGDNNIQSGGEKFCSIWICSLGTPLVISNNKSFSTRLFFLAHLISTILSCFDTKNNSSFGLYPSSVLVTGYRVWRKQNGLVKNMVGSKRTKIEVIGKCIPHNIQVQEWASPELVSIGESKLMHQSQRPNTTRWVTKFLVCWM